MTIALTYFRSLTLANLKAALFSVRQQDLSAVKGIIIFDNNTTDSVEAIQAVVDSMAFPVPVTVCSSKHGDPVLTHSWSTNQAVRHTSTPWVLFTRADYVLDVNLVQKFMEIVESKPAEWDGFITGNVYHLAVNIEACNETEWHRKGPHVLRKLLGAEQDYTCIDAGVWMARRSAFERTQGLDETLTMWGHAQTHFQWKLYTTGTEFVRIPEVMFYHPQHTALRNLDDAHQQLRNHGINLKELWARYEGVQPY